MVFRGNRVVNLQSERKDCVISARGDLILYVLRQTSSSQCLRDSIYSFDSFQATDKCAKSDSGYVFRRRRLANYGQALPFSPTHPQHLCNTMSTVAPALEVAPEGSPLKMPPDLPLKLTPPPPGDVPPRRSSLFIQTPKGEVETHLRMMFEHQEAVEREIEKLDPELLEADLEVPGSKAWILFDARCKLEEVIPELLNLQEEVDGYVSEHRDADADTEDADKGAGKGKGKGNLKDMGLVFTAKGLTTTGIEYDDDFVDYVDQRVNEIMPSDRGILYFFRLQMDGILPDPWNFKQRSQSSSTSDGNGSGSAEGEVAAGPSGSSLDDVVEEVTPTTQTVELPSSLASMSIQEEKITRDEGEVFVAVRPGVN